MSYYNEGRSVNVGSSRGIGFFGMLQILFIALYLIGIEPVASWPWYLLWSPMLVSFGIMCVLLLIVFLILLVYTIIKS